MLYTVHCTVATTYRIITETEKRGKKIYKYTVYKITVQELSMTEIFGFYTLISDNKDKSF